MSDKQVLQLWMYSFDNMENHRPHRSELLGTFMDDDNETAYKKIGDFLQAMNQDRVQPYIGWDKEVYPKFKVKTEWVK